MRTRREPPVVVPARDLDPLERWELDQRGLLRALEAAEIELSRTTLHDDRPRGPRGFRGRLLDRLQAVQVLFQSEGAHRSVAAILAGDYIVTDIVAAGDEGQENLVTSGPIRPWARDLALGADAHRGEIDGLLGRVSIDWDVSRMSRMDRNILRVALYELLFEEEATAAVVGNEAVVLAKALGTDGSATFVNGIVGAVGREVAAGIDPLKGDEPPADEDDAGEDAEREGTGSDTAEEPESEGGGA